MDFKRLPASASVTSWFQSNTENTTNKWSILFHLNRSGRSQMNETAYNRGRVQRNETKKGYANKPKHDKVPFFQAKNVTEKQHSQFYKIPVPYYYSIKARHGSCYFVNSLQAG